MISCSGNKTKRCGKIKAILRSKSALMCGWFPNCRQAKARWNTILLIVIIAKPIPINLLSNCCK